MEAKQRAKRKPPNPPFKKVVGREGGSIGRRENDESEKEKKRKFMFYV